jgi:hypothetical protein
MSARVLDRARFIWSPGADLAVFGGSAAIALTLAACASRFEGEGGEAPLWAFVLLVVAIDVAHVWSTLFRTYLDRGELRRRPFLYAGVPIGCFVAGFALHAISPLTFWRTLAYVAVLHFVRQQVGWVAIYRAKAGERSRWGRFVDDAAVYAATLYPLAWWHANLPRAFRWFVDDDFILVPGLASILPWLQIAWLAALAAYAIRAVVQVIGGATPNLGKHVVVATTAATWYVGIVATDGDLAFTAANVVVHGVPYMVLLWGYARARAGEADVAPGAFATRIVRAGVVVFVALLVGIAFFEELLWDRMVWHARPELFGGSSTSAPLSALAACFAVSLLAVPQATHYVLDAVLWRRRDTGPAQARALGFRPLPTP